MIVMFQFQIGSIRSENVLMQQYIQYVFQFQIGSIRSQKEG